MRSFNPARFCRTLLRGRVTTAASDDLQPPTTALRTVPEPTVYADEPLRRLIIAIDQRASDLELALAEYVHARRAAGVQPEKVLIEFKRLLRRAAGLDEARPRLTGRLIELYFAR
jgi:hypothetical protein